ncbi:MAG: hypothetical protein AAF253_08610 [Pseudomonadota bacterium]
MRSLAISSMLLLGAATALSTATAGLADAQSAGQALAGGPLTLDCRPISTQASEKGVSVTRSYRAQDREPVGTLGGYRCYAAAAPAPVPQARHGASNRQTIIILNGGNLPYGFNTGTSPNVLGAPQARRF